VRVIDVWVRFYKSFNFDYELKARSTGRPPAWQQTSEGWMPHIRVPVEADVTAVVGANESGKTHLLDAIRLVLTGEPHFQRDFCRSSSLFSVEEDLRLFPEVGASFELEDDEVSAMRDSEVPTAAKETLLLLRPRPGQIDVVDTGGDRVQLSVEQIRVIQGLLPIPHDLLTDVALPDSVSIAYLAGNETVGHGRRARNALWSVLAGLTSAEDVTRQAPHVAAMMTTPGRAIGRARARMEPPSNDRPDRRVQLQRTVVSNRR
jgi:hypothetical protein